MKHWDISVTIQPDLPTWPGDPGVKMERVSKIEDGANANVTHLDMGAHTGTHMDAPCHFVSGGISIDQIEPEVLVGSAQVVALPLECRLVTKREIKAAAILPGMTRVLFKTRNSEFWRERPLKFHTDFTAVAVEAAAWLVEMGVKLVGIDYLSIAPYKNSRPAHLTLLRAGVVIVEGLDLGEIPAGVYQLVCLPLKLGGADGAPARAILMSD